MSGFSVKLTCADDVPPMTMDELIRSHERMRVALKYILIESSLDEDRRSWGSIRHCAFRDLVKEKSLDGLGLK